MLGTLDATSASSRSSSGPTARAALAASSVLLDQALRRTANAYALGRPAVPSTRCDCAGRGHRIAGTLAASLERARDLGRGSVAVIRDPRDVARAAARTEALEAAAQVEGKLMLTLVLCHLPALMLLVVIPLFLTLLDGLFG